MVSCATNTTPCIGRFLVDCCRLAFLMPGWMTDFSCLPQLKSDSFQLWLRSKTKATMLRYEFIQFLLSTIFILFFWKRSLKKASQKAMADVIIDGAYQERAAGRIVSVIVGKKAEKVTVGNNFHCLLCSIHRNKN